MRKVQLNEVKTVFYSICYFLHCFYLSLLQYHTTLTLLLLLFLVRRHSATLYHFILHDYFGKIYHMDTRNFEEWKTVLSRMNVRIIGEESSIILFGYRDKLDKRQFWNYHSKPGHDSSLLPCS